MFGQYVLGILLFVAVATLLHAIVPDFIYELAFVISIATIIALIVTQHQ